MKLVNLHIKIVLALLTSVVISTSASAQAGESGFTLDDSIRTQIFLELKSNVESLYQSNRIYAADVETSTTTKIASGRDSIEFAVPLNLDNNTTTNSKSIETIY